MFRRVVFSIFCLVPGQLLAGTLYNNLGPGDTFSSGIWEGQNVSLIGLTFTTTSAGTLSTVLLPIASALNAPGVTFTLYSDSMGAPGSQIESWTGNPPADNGGEPPLTTLTSVQSPLSPPARNIGS